MATFQDNINTIQTAIYGKEMRPAISEALTQGWNSVKTMMNAVDKLNDRVDSLSGGGGTVDPDNPDQPSGTRCYVVGDTVKCVNGVITPLSSVGYADIF